MREGVYHSAMPDTLPSVFEAEFTPPSLQFLQWVQDALSNTETSFYFFADKQRFHPFPNTPEGALQVLCTHPMVGSFYPLEDEPPGSVATVHVYGKFVEVLPDLNREQMIELQEGAGSRGLWFKEMQLPSAEALVDGVSSLLTPNSFIGAHVEVLATGALIFRLSKTRVRQLQADRKRGVTASSLHLLEELRHNASTPFLEPLHIHGITHYCQILNTVYGLQVKHVTRDKCETQGVSFLPRQRRNN